MCYTFHRLSTYVPSINQSANISGTMAEITSIWASVAINEKVMMNQGIAALIMRLFLVR